MYTSALYVYNPASEFKLRWSRGKSEGEWQMGSLSPKQFLTLNLYHHNLSIGRGCGNGLPRKSTFDWMCSISRSYQGLVYLIHKFDIYGYPCVSFMSCFKSFKNTADRWKVFDFPFTTSSRTKDRNQNVGTNRWISRSFNWKKTWFEAVQVRKRADWKKVQKSHVYLGTDLSGCQTIAHMHVCNDRVEIQQIG